MANLKIGDLHLEGDNPVLIVRQGKGAKDRAVNLNSSIREQLATFTKDKQPQESVFGLAAKTISMKIGYWARRSGVPQLHTHSLRHYVGTTLFERHANPRAVQAILGHESLDVTMRYVSVIGQDTKEAISLLDDKPASKSTDKEEVDELLSWAKEEGESTRKYVVALKRSEARTEAWKKKVGLNEIMEKYGGPKW